MPSGICRYARDVKPALVVPMLALALLTAPCNRTPPPGASPRPKAQPATQAKPQLFGQPLAGGERVALGAVLADPDGNAGRAVLVEGRVRQACSRKGCWMELAETLDKGTQGCRVTFKDYGFFVPTTSAGAHARVQGVVEVTEVKPSMVRHLEEEGAVFAHKSEDGSAREVRVVATGVELWR